MQDLFEMVFMKCLIGLGLSLFYLELMRIDDKNQETLLKALKENKANLTLPLYYIWLGLPTLTIGLFMLFGDFEEPLLNRLLYSSPFILLGTYSTMAKVLWKIRVDNDLDYFTYRNMFGRKFKISYNEISDFKRGKYILVFKYKRKYFIVDTNAVNYPFFNNMFIKNEVKKVFK